MAHGDLSGFAASIQKAIPTIQKKRDDLIALFDRWALTGLGDPKKLKAAITSFNNTFEKSILSIKPPETARLRERDRMELALGTLRHMTWQNIQANLNKVYKGISAGHFQPDVLAKMLRDAVSGFIEHDLRYSIENLIEDDRMMVPEQFQLGKFTVTDDYGLHERSASHWFDAVRHASKILEAKGFGYLLYGRLVLTDSDQWGGMYYSADDHVDLYLNKNEGGHVGSLVTTLIHELGHRLWFKFLDQGRRDLFSAPWIDQDEIVREVYEKVNQVLTVPPQEKEEAFKIIRDYGYLYSKFIQWATKTPERHLRWRRLAGYIVPDLGADAAYMVEKGDFSKEGFAKARKFVAERDHYLKEQEDEATRYPPGSDDHKTFLEQAGKVRERIARMWESHHREWTEDKPQLQMNFSVEEIQEAFEPGRLDTQHPLAREIQEVLKISPIKPSVSEYGQTNRKEDFAETFEKVMMGKEKRHEYVVKLQRAVPKGTVASTKIRAFVPPGVRKVAQEFEALFRKAGLKVRPAEREGSMSLHWLEGPKDNLVEVTDQQVTVDTDRVLKWPLRLWGKAKEFLSKELGIHPLVPAESDGYFSIKPLVPMEPTLDPGPTRSTAMNRMHPTVRKQIIAAMLDAKRPDLANAISKAAAEPVRAVKVYHNFRETLSLSIREWLVGCGYAIGKAAKLGIPQEAKPESGPGYADGAAALTFKNIMPGDYSLKVSLAYDLDEQDLYILIDSPVHDKSLTLKLPPSQMVPEKIADKIAPLIADVRKSVQESGISR